MHPEYPGTPGSPTQRADKTQSVLGPAALKHTQTETVRPGQKEGGERQEEGGKRRRRQRRQSWRKERGHRLRREDELGLVIIPFLLFISETNNYY